MDAPQFSTGTPVTSSSHECPDPDLGQAVRRGLSRPVDDLERTVRALSDHFDADDPRADELSGLLDQIERLGRNVRALFDYAHQPEPRALCCTVDEVLYTARFHLPHELWGRLEVARERDLPTLDVDGPVLARSIARLIEAAAPLARTGVLLYAYRDGEAIHFTITFQGCSAFLGDPTGLGHAIAWRDLAVIGCEAEERTATPGDTTIHIRVPGAMVQGSAA